MWWGWVQDLKWSEEGVRLPGARVTGEWLQVGARNWTQVLWKNKQESLTTEPFLQPSVSCFGKWISHSLLHPRKLSPGIQELHLTRTAVIPTLKVISPTFPIIWDNHVFFLKYLCMCIVWLYIHACSLGMFICHSTCVEVRGHPWVLSPSTQTQSFVQLYIHQASWPRGFSNSFSASHLSIGTLGLYYYHVWLYQGSVIQLSLHAGNTRSFTEISPQCWQPSHASLK